MKAALLDVNVLIALIDPSHEFHDFAHAWFQRNRRHGWATCPITENACVRILGKPGYPYLGITVPEVRDILSELCRAKDHRFWPDSVSLLDNKRFDLAGAGSKNITDIYLLGIADAQGGRLATFDQSIRQKSVPRAQPDSVEVIAPGARS
jgi:toxin-antitoxin system PIN domain toxin